MAKGKITEYSVDSFSPTAVGVPAQDRSGQILASGVETLGKALAQREETSDTLSAMDKFGAFQLQYEQSKLELQRQYQDKPLEFAAAAKTLADKLSEGMSKDMSSGVFQKFKTYTTNATIQDTDNNVKWAFARDNEIQLGKVSSSLQNVALLASRKTSAQDLAQSIGVWDENQKKYVGGDMDVIGQTATKFMSREAFDKLAADQRKTAIDFNMKAQMMSRPLQLKADLEGGAYNGILAPDEIKKYSDEARNSTINKKYDDTFLSLYKAQGKIIDFAKRLDDGSASVIDLIAEREAVYPKSKMLDPDTQEPLVSPEYVRNLDILIDSQTQAMARVPGNEGRRKEILKSFDDKWHNYLVEHQNAMKTPSPKDLDDELKLMGDLREQYLKGNINRTDYESKMAIMSYRTKGINTFSPKPFDQAVDEAGMVKNWIGQKTAGKDVVSQGYQLISKHVDAAYKELNVEERRDLKAQMLSQYHQVITSQPEGFEKGLKTDNERAKFAQDHVMGIMNARGERTPGVIQRNSSLTVAGQTHKPGDNVPYMGVPRIFKGKDPATGQPMYEVPQNVIGTVVTVNGQQIKVTGLDSQGRVKGIKIKQNA